MTAPTTAPWPVAIRPDAWRKLRNRTATRTNTALAARLGLARPTVSRVMAGKSRPDVDFVAATLAAFHRAGWRFDDLFRWTDE